MPGWQDCGQATLIVEEPTVFPHVPAGHEFWHVEAEVAPDCVPHVAEGHNIAQGDVAPLLLLQLPGAQETLHAWACEVDRTDVPYIPGGQE